MKNLFEIDSDEIKRILSLHETSTKQQYLNILTEQISQNNKKAFGKKGTFDNPYTDADLQKWPVDWMVDTLDGYSNKGDLENLYRYLQAFKGKVALVDTGAKKVKQSALSRIYYLYKVDEDIDLATDIKAEKAIDNATKITKDKLVSFINSTRSAKVVAPTVGSPTGNVADPKQLAKAQKCGHKSWQEYQASGWKCNPTNQVVDPNLVKAQKCGYKSWDEYKASGWKCNPANALTVDDSKLTPQQKEYKDKVSGINKQIQTALGVQGGDGNLTQADYQAIYNKLLQ